MELGLRGQVLILTFIQINGWIYGSDQDGMQLLTISGALSGDGFPASEAFVTDDSGNSVFIGVSQADYGPQAGPLFALLGNKARKK